MAGCSGQHSNPFYQEWETPFGVPPFDQIEEAHYLPVFRKGMQQQKREIREIVDTPEAPTFANTIEALERSGKLLRKVSNVFYNLTSAYATDRIQAISKKVAPLLSQHNDDILMNNQLFRRVLDVYEQREALEFTTEQATLLDKYYKDFVRGGAGLGEEQQARLREINQELAELSVQFGENLLKENNRFELVIEDESDLAGLTEDVISTAAETAQERGHEGKWVFTLHKPSLIPFLQYSDRRDLREKMFTAYINRGNHGDELDNKEIVSRMASLRVERARLLGYATHAHYILKENMAKTPQNVYDLLHQLWNPALKRAQQEARDLQQMISDEGKNFQLQPWDWWYYAEKLKKARYELDDEILRPYFPLEQVRQGIFEVANKLYGLTFEEQTDVPKYHEEVQVFEVKESDGSHVGLLYTDYFPRDTKRGGAWMNAYREQSRLYNEEVTPVITNVFNFSEPTGGKPALLSFEEVQTMFHEFGHALHGLLSDCTYPRLSGTSVPRDFVELPSQIMENWAAEPAVLKSYARHYQTGEPIPDALIDKIRNARLFNQGFATVEYLAASYLDMDWHTLTEPKEYDVLEFEKHSMETIGLIPEIVVRYRSPYFQHIFVSGYSAGYYSYIWAEVLDADAFQAFRETSLFDRATADAFRENILAAGGTEEPMVLYKRFRGAEPNIEPLLERRGLQ